MGSWKHRRHRHWHHSQTIRSRRLQRFGFLVIYLVKFLRKQFQVHLHQACADDAQIFCGYLVPFFYIPSYGQVELGMSRGLALYTLVISSGVSVVGRLISATVAQRVGAMIPWITCAVVSAIMCLAWIGIHSVAAFLVFAALYGKPGFSEMDDNMSTSPLRTETDSPCS